MRSSICFFVISFFVFYSEIHGQDKSIPKDYKLVYSQSFDNPQDIFDFEMTDHSVWRIGSMKNNNSLELFEASEYEASVRSPFNIAILKELELGSFIMEVDLSQTGREYGHRDLCLFFGFQDPTNFYYTHIASVADVHANNIFIVNDEPRKSIASSTTEGTDWGDTDSWHKVRIEREIPDGTIKVYFDDMKNPIMEATDLHFGEGRIGLGSFDDTGRFDNIKIWAPTVTRHQLGIFRASNQKK